MRRLLKWSWEAHCLPWSIVPQPIGVAETNFPCVAKLARRYLCILATGMPSESVLHCWGHFHLPQLHTETRCCGQTGFPGTKSVIPWWGLITKAYICNPLVSLGITLLSNMCEISFVFHAASYLTGCAIMLSCSDLVWYVIFPQFSIIAEKATL